MAGGPLTTRYGRAQLKNNLIHGSRVVESQPDTNATPRARVSGGPGPGNQIRNSMVETTGLPSLTGV